MGHRRDELKKWALGPAVAALLALSGGGEAAAADLETEALDASVYAAGDSGDGMCKDGECKEGQCKDGDCKDKECKEGSCKEGACKGA